MGQENMQVRGKEALEPVKTRIDRSHALRSIRRCPVGGHPVTAIGPVGQGEVASDPSEHSYWYFQLRGLSGNADVLAIPRAQQINVARGGIEKKVPVNQGVDNPCWQPDCLEPVD